MNPYRPPKDAPTKKITGRGTPWKGFCLGALCAAILLTIVAAATKGGKSDAFKIFDGLLAFGQLISWMMVGVGGIGWVFTRNR